MLHRVLKLQCGMCYYYLKKSEGVQEMSKNNAKDIDNVMRLITKLPADEAEKVLKEIKKEKDPEGKRRIISSAMDKRGLKPL